MRGKNLLNKILGVASIPSEISQRHLYAYSKFKQSYNSSCSYQNISRILKEHTSFFFLFTVAFGASQ